MIFTYPTRTVRPTSSRKWTIRPTTSSKRRWPWQSQGPRRNSGPRCRSSCVCPNKEPSKRKSSGGWTRSPCKNKRSERSASKKSWPRGGFRTEKGRSRKKPRRWRPPEREGRRRYSVLLLLLVLVLLHRHHPVRLACRQRSWEPWALESWEQPPLCWAATAIRRRKKAVRFLPRRTIKTTMAVMGKVTLRVLQMKV